jgi:NADP-dependent 3-hydroxy acid dehydrogenase YdfG
MITGASRGIGRAIAVRLASLGYGLFLLGRDDAALDSVAQQCRGEGVPALCLAGDITDARFRDEAVGTAVERLGGIDVLVNNAGQSNTAPVQTADLEVWQAVLEVNFSAAMHLCRQVLPGMIERNRGAVVNISSILGRATDAGSAIYAATKHALNGFSGCLYEDVRDHGIKVSTIMPGFVETAMTSAYDFNAAHLIQPDDVADAVEYVLNSSAGCCPTEIVIRPQKRP